MLKIDFHLHTSEDPVDYLLHDAEALVDRAAGMGFDALAITLHDRQLETARLADYARERGLVLLPGVERTIAGKHLLLINFPQEAERVRSFEAVKRLKERGNGLVIAPHPFFPDRSCLGGLMEQHASLFDAVEWSYFWTRGVNFNERAKRWARTHGKPVVGNSDLHDLRQLGRTHSWVRAERDPDAICEAVRSGRVEVRTEPVPPVELARVFGGMVWRGQQSAHQLQVPREEPHPQIVRPLPGVIE